MENCTDLVEDAEILVNTDENEPRGTSAENDRQTNMTTFETLVHTVLALEEDPLNEHSYAYSDKKLSKEGMAKDHCYYAGSRLCARRRKQSLSDEDLSDPPCFDDKYILLPHYCSNDSALDVTGFDNISEKCLSNEKLNVKTVDVFTDNFMLPGVSDLSMMTIQDQTSFSLPNSPVSSDSYVKEHSYSIHRERIEKQNGTQVPFSVKKDFFLTDHTYTNFPSWRTPLKDHTYTDFIPRCPKRRDSLPSNVGIKRGRSNDDLRLLGSNYTNNNSKRKDFFRDPLLNSPFLDQSYQSAIVQNGHTRNKKPVSIKKQVAKTYENLTNHEVLNNSDMGNKRDSCEKTYIVEQALLPNRLLIDHSYEVTDSTVDMPTGFVTKVNSNATDIVENELTQMFGEIKTEKSDHSYVIREDDSLDKEFDSDLNEEKLSDSGTESLNGDDDDMVIPVTKQTQSSDKEQKEHTAYCKRTNKEI